MNGVVGKGVFFAKFLRRYPVDWLGFLLSCPLTRFRRTLQEQSLISEHRPELSEQNPSLAGVGAKVGEVVGFNQKGGTEKAMRKAIDTSTKIYCSQI